MLKQNPKTLIQANQVSIYIKNHLKFAETDKMGLVLEGYQKLETYIKRLVEMCNDKAEAIWPEQVELQVHLVRSLIESILSSE